MRILIHDFCGHAFTLGLAVALSQRGHEVAYAYFASETGPKGDFVHAEREAPSLEIAGLLADVPYRKDAFLARRRHDRYYARALARYIRAYRADAVVSANCPTEVQSHVLAASSRAGSAFVYWMQDLYSQAAGKLLRRRFGPLGSAVGAYWGLLDRRHLRCSDHVVLITEDFRTLTQRWSRRRDRIDVIENWAALDQIPVRPQSNAWSRTHGLGCDGRVHFLYAGTLGLKHDPELLVQIADRLGDRIRLTVAGHGASIPYLHRRRDELHLEDSLSILPLQPFACLPEMLASADVLVAMLEAEAGTFSVPSKVLSYLCAQRAILLAAPSENLASQLVRRADAGLVVDPDDLDGFVHCAERLLRPEERRDYAVRARAFAEDRFNIAEIASRFESILARFDPIGGQG